LLLKGACLSENGAGDGLLNVRSRGAGDENEGFTNSKASRTMAMISMSVLLVKAPVECSTMGDVVSGLQASIFENDNFDIIRAI
jgi:hypothetical protein